MSGVGAGIAALRIGARLTGAAGMFKRIPRWAWIALAVAALLTAGFFWHQHKAHAALKAADESGYARAVKVYERALVIVRQRAIERRRKAEAEGRAISSKLKERHDEQVRHIAADADALRMRGPGAAAGCRPGDRPGLPAAAGGAERGGRSGAAAAGPLSASDRLALVPWSWLVDGAQQADESRAEVLTWREWYAQQAAAWEKNRASRR